MFFQGAAFIIEDEESIASDEEVSVKTSEDDFDYSADPGAQLIANTREKRRIVEEDPSKEIKRLINSLE